MYDRISIEQAKERIRKYVEYIDIDPNNLPEIIESDKIQVLCCCYKSIGSINVAWQVGVYDLTNDTVLDRFNVV